MVMLDNLLMAPVDGGFHLDPGTVLGIGLAIFGTVISIVIWIASTRATNITKSEATPSAYLRRVDDEAFDRARRIYEAAIDQLEEELRRVNGMAQELQLEVFKLSTELARIRQTQAYRHDTGPQRAVSDGDSGSDAGS
jgi:hypothetical protein